MKIKKCQKNHSGNKTLVLDCGAYQCQGCGQYYTVRQIASGSVESSRITLAAGREGWENGVKEEFADF